MNINTDIQLTIEETFIEKVEECTYLEKAISIKGIESELTVRKKKGWKSYWALKGIFKKKKKHEYEFQNKSNRDVCDTSIILWGTDVGSNKIAGKRIKNNTTSDGAEHNIKNQ